MTEERHKSRGTLLLILLGIAIGVIVLSAVRLVAMPEEQHVHYHANWAIFINGERLDLSDDIYMEDVFSCSADPNNQRPEDRIHMHENNEDVVHVHDSGATWGHLMANIGFAIGDDYLITDQGRYQEDGERTLKFIVNGMPVSSIRNRPVRSEDRLLISYGPRSEDEILAEQFEQVASSAGEYNTQPDPASCSGHEEATLGTRLKRAVLW